MPPSLASLPGCFVSCRAFPLDYETVPLFAPACKCTCAVSLLEDYVLRVGVLRRR